jgi:D-alanyl-D-alanine carboxypeptidase
MLKNAVRILNLDPDVRSLAFRNLSALLFSATLICGASGLVQAAPPYAAIVVDAHTGKILHSKDGDGRRYPASLTKAMTLYLLFEELKAGTITLKTELVVTANAANQAPSRLGLKAGERISVIDAIRALVTKSANDVAVAVAENLAGTEQSFARTMTAKAHKLGMAGTTFRNASGLPNGEQVTTARDMATLSLRLISDFPSYYGFFKTRYFTYKGRRYRNHNKLLFRYKGTDGIKTGYTRASGFNLVASVRRGRKHLVAVVIGGRSPKKRDSQMVSLLSKSFRKAVAYDPKTAKHKVARIAGPATPALPATRPVPPRRQTARTETRAKVLNSPGAQGPVARDSRPETPPAQTAAAFTGPFQVQIGAYADVNLARENLQLVFSKAEDLLKGHPPITMPHSDPTIKLIRARFAAFSEADAHNTCAKLKERAIACFVSQAH